MRLQDTAENCGPAAMSNALSAMGITRTQAECEALCGTKAGTSERQLFAALTRVNNLTPAALSESRAEVALLRIEAALRRGSPSILAVDDWGHWVAVVGMLGDRFLLADGGDNELILSVTAGELVRRWAGPGRKPYYGVIL